MVRVDKLRNVNFVQFIKYSSGQNKVNVRLACNDRATVIALERNEKKRRTETHLDGPVFLILFFIRRNIPFYGTHNLTHVRFSFVV